MKLLANCEKHNKNCHNSTLRKIKVLLPTVLSFHTYIHLFPGFSENSHGFAPDPIGVIYHGSPGTRDRDRDPGRGTIATPPTNKYRNSKHISILELFGAGERGENPCSDRVE